VSRDAPRRETNSWFRPLKSLPRKANEDIVDVSLFYSHFSSRKPVCNENNHGAGHAVDRFINAIDRCFSSSPLLNRDCGSLFEVRNAREKVLSRKNMAPSFEGHSDPRNMHSGSFTGRRRGLPTWRGFFSAPWRALARLHLYGVLKRYYTLTPSALTMRYW